MFMSVRCFFFLQKEIIMIGHILEVQYSYVVLSAANVAGLSCAVIVVVSVRTTTTLIIISSV